MKRLLKKGMLVVTSLMFMGVAAHAADLGNYPRDYSCPACNDTVKVKWSELYVMGAVGYGQQHREYSVDYNDDGEAHEIGSLSGISTMGANATLGLGYNFQVPGSILVVGARAGYEFDLDTEGELNFGPFNATLERGDTIFVGGIIGALLNDRTLGYLHASYLRREGGKLKFTGGEFKFDDRDGFGLGAGLSTALSERWKLYGEYQHNFFEDGDIANFEGITIREEIDEDIIKVGISYSVM